jgi:phosphoribosyl 1,2-cyclic phosphodiesterase
MSIFFQVLASGSKGNSTLVCTSRTRVLIDAGLSGKELVRRMAKSPVQAGNLDAVIISHEHQDHVRGAGVISRRFDLPVFLSRGTLENLPSQVGQPACLQLFQTGIPFEIGDLRFHPFAISHDAKDPSGFVIESEGCRLGICTDLGIATQLVKARLQGCDGLILEANHDTELLLNGPYPWELKQRIRSRHGHLSNSDSCELLKALHHGDLKCVVLAHLSEINNNPEVVRKSCEDLVRSEEWSGIRFEIGRQDEALAGVELA